jgi:hypothetical protein
VLLRLLLLGTEEDEVEDERDEDERQERADRVRGLTLGRRLSEERMKDGGHSVCSG